MTGYNSQLLKHEHLGVVNLFQLGVVKHFLFPIIIPETINSYYFCDTSDWTAYIVILCP
jgi:hypothetical protein